MYAKPIPHQVVVLHGGLVVVEQRKRVIRLDQEVVLQGAASERAASEGAASERVQLQNTSGLSRHSRQHTILIEPTKRDPAPPHIDTLVLVVVDDGREEGEKQPRVRRIREQAFEHAPPGQDAVQGPYHIRCMDPIKWRQDQDKAIMFWKIHTRSRDSPIPVTHVQ